MRNSSMVCLIFLLVVCQANAQDITPPVITLKGPPLVRVFQWYSYVDGGYTVSDDVDDVSQIVIETQGSYTDTKTPGQFSLRYKASDKAGNIAYSDWRNIIVQESTGISEESNAGKPAVFPNPTKGQLSVVFEGAATPEFRMTDLAGRNIAFSAGEIAPSSLHISLAGNAPGVYLLYIRTPGNISVQKIYLE